MVRFVANLVFFPLIFFLFLSGAAFAEKFNLNSDNVEVIEIYAEPTTTDQIAMSLRLAIEQGIIQDFELDPRLSESGIPACQESEIFTTTIVCVDILNSPIGTPFLTGEHIATITIKWDSNIPGKIIRSQGNGYSNAETFTDVNDLQIANNSETLTISTQTSQLNLIVLLAIVLILFVIFLIVYLRRIGLFKK